ncbi:MAG: penicillin-binding protein activator LpoB [Elusimicrobiota bacterium]
MFQVIVITLLSLSFFISCGGGKVARVGVDETIDLSGEWNDTDSRLVAEAMIGDCLSRAWYGKYEASGKKPTIIVGRIQNKSHEHINVETFANDMQRELINSGKVTFVAGRSQKTDVREERADQEIMASEATKKEMQNETGAELILLGSINTIEDAIEGKRVMYYQVDLELIHVESNEKFWIGTKKIKKLITRDKYKL